MNYLYWVVLIIPLAGLGANTVRQYQDQDTGLDAWEWQADSIKLQQIQRLPDQTRAFFLGRGFKPDEAERIASTCVFQTIFYNLGRKDVSIELNKWHIVTSDGNKPLKLTSDWQSEWERLGVSQASRIAFQWALFPNTQQFAPGDWNMGMITYPASPGSSFDLHFVWKEDDKHRQAVLPGLGCARDVTRSAGDNL